VKVGGTSLFVSPRSSTSAIRAAEPRYTGYQKSLRPFADGLLVASASVSQNSRDASYLLMPHIIAEINSFVKVKIKKVKFFVGNAKKVLTGWVFSVIMWAMFFQTEDEKYRLLERLIYLDGGVHPVTGRRVMSQELWEQLIDDELRSLDGPKRFEPWDKMGWCKAPVKEGCDEASS